MSIFDSIKRLFGGAPTGRGASDAEERGSRSLDDDEVVDCEEALRLVHDFLDGELDGVPASQVKRHFEMCGHCYPHLKLETAYREAVRRASAGGGAPPGLKAKIAALLAEAQRKD